MTRESRYRTDRVKLSSLPTCRETGKVAHTTYYDAVRHVKFLSRSARDNLRNIDCYRCKHCRLWHVGHSKRVK